MTIPPAMTFDQIKSDENHRTAIKRQAIMFYKSKENVFAGERPMKRWTLCVQMILDTWICLGPQRDHVPKTTLYLGISD